MAMTARLPLHDEILQETAARLIHILGLDKAISVCRSNYWHAVLPFVLAYEKSLDQRSRAFGFARHDPKRRRGLSQTVTNRRHLIPKAAPPAIAA